MEIEQVAVVGDIHGEIGPLDEAVRWLDESWPGRIIFVGDYVNRGSDSRAVLELLVQCRQRWGQRASFLLGNHDVAMLRWLDTGSVDDLVGVGGLTTVRSYLGSGLSRDAVETARQRVPSKHYDFLSNLDVFVETDEVLVSHCGPNPGRLGSRAESDLVLGSHPTLFSPSFSMGATTAVFGHYAQRTRRPYLSAGAICVDSGCGTIPRAPLSVVTLPDRRVRMFKAGGAV